MYASVLLVLVLLFTIDQLSVVGIEVCLLTDSRKCADTPITRLLPYLQTKLHYLHNGLFLKEIFKSRDRFGVQVVVSFGNNKDTS